METMLVMKSANRRNLTLEKTGHKQANGEQNTK